MNRGDRQSNKIEIYWPKLNWKAMKYLRVVDY